jgi:hypothetical protein
MQFRNDRTAAVVALAKTAAHAGATRRALDLLAEADGLEAWAGANCAAPSRAAIMATIKHVRTAAKAGTK